MAMTRKRKVLLGIAGLLLLLIALVAAIPLWFPWTLQPILKKSGIELGSYQRRGYSRLLLMDVKYAKDGTKFSVKRIQIVQPTAWLWSHYFDKRPPENFAKIVGWRLEIPESKSPKKEKTNQAPSVLLGKINSALPKIISWLPRARFENGEVRFKKEQISIPTLIWDRGLIRANISSMKRGQSGELTLFTTTEPKELSLKLDPMNVGVDLRISSDGGLVKLKSTIAWKTNRIHMTAQLRDEWLPEIATAEAKNFRLAASLIKLEGYDDLHGTFSSHWERGRFSVNLDADAQPKNAAALPPVFVTIHANGTTNSFRIEQANVSTPWLKANLSRGVEMDFSGKLLSPEAALSLDVDLNKQEFVAASGRLSGEAFLRRTEKKYPHVEFQLAGGSMETAGVRTKALNFAGTLDWPWLQISPAEVRFADGGIATGKARVNFVAREFQTGHVEVRGQLGPELLKNITYSNLVIVADFNGPFTEPNHSARVEVDGLNLPKMTPMKVVAGWTGKFLDIEKLEASVAARSSELKLSGAAKMKTNEAALKLDAFTLTKSGDQRLMLENQATILLKKADGGFIAQSQNLDLRGENRQLGLDGNLTWPGSGQITATATNLNAAEFQDFFIERLPKVQVDDFSFSGSWTNGPVDFVLRTRGQFSAARTNVFSFSALGSGDNDGTTFEEVKVLSESGPVLTARGFLPVRINPAGTNKLEIRSKQIIDFRADTVPNKVFWDQIAAWTKVNLTNPDLHMLVSGTLEKPKGKIVARAEKVVLRPKQQRKIPSVDNIQIEVDLNEETIHLAKFMASIEGQPISMTAELPMGKDFSQNWSRVFDWRKARGKIVVNDAEFAPFVKFLPEILSPQGRLRMDIAFAPGPKFDGWLAINDAATRPFAGTGPLHDLQVRLRFIDQRIEFQDVHGLLGGQPIALSGKVDFQKMKKQFPLMDLKLTGQNVPLTRQPEAIIRGNLNLGVSNLTNDRPAIVGEVELRDSFYLGDIKQLAPGKVASPERRPPFFSIDKDPLGDWSLNVRVTGENFLKVRSPIFRGLISANLRVIGNLREPIALGDVQVESGTVQFPFANFTVTQGLVTLTSDNPYHPDLFVTASSRAFSYDLQLNVEGPADKPIIEFTSVPSLTSEQIILMVTTGEIPRKDFGYSTQQRAQKLAMFVGKSILSKFSEPSGAERLTITSGEEISEKGRETYALEYKLSDRWSVVGEYDRFGALNVGMKWRVYSK